MLYWLDFSESMAKNLFTMPQSGNMVAPIASGKLSV